jgi:dihydrolipoamide dehydrogenase
VPEFDLVVVGAGPGGYTAAIRGAQLGMSVALIEKDSLGGVCTNWGCVPSKAILHSAEVINLFKEAPELGIGYDNLRLDLAVAIDRSRTVVDTMVSGIDTLLKQNKVTLIKGTAKLTAATAVTVSPGGEKVSGKNLILATGGVSRSIPGIPIDGDRVLTSREALDLREMPQSVVIVGGGPIGVEFAYFWRSFGANVTIVELLDRILPNEDEDVSHALERAFRAQGIELRTGTGVEGVEVGEGGVMVKVARGAEKETISGDRVLIGVGFGPNTDGLGLNDIGVTLERGFVKIDDVCKTNLPGLWAIGDVTGRLLLAHVATAQGVTAVETMAGLQPPPLDYVRMPRAVYCQPQVASLGLTETQAREKGLNIRTSRFPFRANGKAVAIGQTDGFVKLVVDWDTRDIVGYHAIGYAATEMIAEASLGSALETTAEAIGQTVHAHPTLSEVMHEAALAITGEAINFYAPRRDS